MDSKMRHRLQKLLESGESSHPIDYLRQDAARLWKRVQRFADMKLASISDEKDAVELACYALQLPLRQRKLLPGGKLGRTSLKERSEQSAELLVSQLGGEIDDMLLDRTTRLLHELPHKSPMLDAAKLLADVLNLDDFGVVGLVNLTLQLGRQGASVTQVAEANEKREQYGYWDARLRDGFHFDAIRLIARRRLDRSRQIVKQLTEELAEDEP